MYHKNFLIEIKDKAKLLIIFNIPLCWKLLKELKFVLKNVSHRSFPKIEKRSEGWMPPRKQFYYRGREGSGSIIIYFIIAFVLLESFREVSGEKFEFIGRALQGNFRSLTFDS